MLLQKINNYRSVVTNTFYLSIIQVINLVSPLIALPYVIRTIGTDRYGLIVFTQSIAAYFFILINFGLDISAVRDVSQNRNDKAKLSQIASSVLAIKGVLFVATALIFAVMVFAIPNFRANYVLFIIVFLAAIGEIIFPAWFYQGIEKMGMLSIVKLISVLFYISTLFFVVTDSSDYLFVPILQVSGSLISAFIGLTMLIKVEKVRFRIPIIGDMIVMFKESLPFFISRVSVVVNANIAQTLTGIFLGMREVAIFDLAKKIINFALIPLQMFMSTLYPHNANKQDKNLVRKLLYVIGIMVALEVAAVYILAPFAVKFFAGDSLSEAVQITRILLIYLAVGAFGVYLGSPVLVAFGYPKPYNMSVLYSTATLLICFLILYLFDLFTLTNFAIALILPEIVILIYRYYHCKKYEIIAVRWL